ncbi:MAG: radical SAM family heme chaperone HemW [Myxococcota bacterium]
MRGVTDASVGVYVHVPFCERVCPYCDFAVVAAGDLDPEVEWRYVDAVLRELELRRVAFSGRSLASLYLGGGTPSLLRPESVERLIDAVTKTFVPDEGLEVTLEVNPSTVERERLPAFRAAGVNRVSLGVQSFNDRVLKRLGRAHVAEEARRTLEACRAAGFGCVSLDLIFAAPGETLAVFERDLDEALAFAPEHLSTYELTIERGTPFHTAAARGQLALPAEGESVAMIERAEARLGEAGFTRYELSNYAQPGRESVHNRRYWERKPVLGLGVGAFSTDPPGASAPFGVRRANGRGLPTYLARIEAGRSPESGAGEVLGAGTARGEAIFLSLRAARGVDAERFAAEFGQPPRGFYGAAIEALVGDGLLEEGAGGDLRLTPRGRLLSDSVFAHFV